MQPATVEETTPDAGRVYIYNLPETDDAKDFEALFAFVVGTQHDHAPANWDGTQRTVGYRYFRERYYPRAFVPLDAGSPWSRKPDVVTPLAREIVWLFTAVLLANITIHVPVDADTEAFYAAVWKHGKYAAAFATARNMAGGARAAIVIPRIVGGRPLLDVIKPSQCRVLKWSETEVCQPEVIVRQRLVRKDVKGETGLTESREFWRTCMWTATDYVEFADVPKDHDPDVALTETKRAPHGCSRCPATWYRNTASESDCKWGTHDFDQLEGRCDAADQLGAQLRGAVGNNVDPTLFQFDEESTRRRHLIGRKGRGVLVQGSDKAKAGFLQLDAEGIRVGLEYFDRLIDETMTLAGCTRIPASMASKMSGRAIKLHWKPTENKANILAPELIDTIVRVLELNYEMAQAFGVSSIEDPRKDTIILPSRVISEAPPHDTPEEQAEGAAEAPATLTMESRKRFEVCAPGRFGGIEVEIGDYFPPVAEERTSELQGLQTASGASAILSRKTAIERAATVIGVDPVEECRRIAEEEEERLANAPDFAPDEDGEAEGEAKPGEEADEETDEGEGEEEEPEDDADEDAEDDDE